MLGLSQIGTLENWTGSSQHRTELVGHNHPSKTGTW